MTRGTDKRSRPSVKPVRFRSRRSDGRGHWPRGRRLHTDAPIGGWRSTSELIAEAIPHATQRGLGVELARRIGVHRRTLDRWRSREDLPSPGSAKRLAQWMHEQRSR